MKQISNLTKEIINHLKKVNTQYCYLSDVVCGEFRPESFSSEFQGKKLFKYLNGKKYKDPDADSKKLYVDLRMLFNGNKGTLSGPDKDYYDNWFLMMKDVKITSDYIGPSVYRAKEVGIEDNQIGHYLMICRTIGGHMFWPSKCTFSGKYNCKMEKIYYSINTARGNLLHDRIDLTFLELKKWYETKNASVLQKYFDLNEKWLNIFVDFPGFINFFLLNDFIVEGSYDVKDLSSYDKATECYMDTLTEIPTSISLDRKTYKMFISGNKKAIEMRNARIAVL